MQYYAIQIYTAQEDNYIRRARRAGLAPGLRLFIPKRLLTIRKGGKTANREMTVFPGYVFLEIEGEELDEESRWKLRRAEGFIRFLQSTLHPTPLPEADRRVLLHFISFGERADKSKVTFDESDRIQVLEGPLKGLEGRIVRVDRRRGRAKVSLDLCSTGFLIDLGFEVVARVTQGGDGSHGTDKGG